MEATKVLTKEERHAKAVKISKMLLESKRETQKQMREDMQNPDSVLYNLVQDLKAENAKKGHPYAV